MSVSISYPTLDIWKKHFGDDFLPDAKKIGVGTGVFQNYPPSNYPLSPHNASKLRKHPILSLLLKNFKYAGADLSVMLQDTEVEWNGKTIVIVAQDPLRSKKDYSMCNAKPGNDIVVSLPFCVQATLPNTSCVVVVGVIKKLLADGYKVFLTDINKFFVIGNNNQKVPVTGSVRKLFDQVLEDELNMIEPDKIVVMGNKAAQAVNRIKVNAPIVATLHPSDQANGYWNKKLGFTDINSKIDYIYNKIIP